MNNYSDEDVARITNRLSDAARVKYAVYGFEVAPTTGTCHLQGYISFKLQKNLAAVKRFLGSNSVHIEVAIGNAEENRVYCIKDGDFHEYGELTRARQVTMFGGPMPRVFRATAVINLTVEVVHLTLKKRYSGK